MGSAISQQTSGFESRSMDDSFASAEDETMRRLWAPRLIVCGCATRLTAAIGEVSTAMRSSRRCERGHKDGYFLKPSAVTMESNISRACGYVLLCPQHWTANNCSSTMIVVSLCSPNERALNGGALHSRRSDHGRISNGWHL
jgi:hypothetical protein